MPAIAGLVPDQMVHAFAAFLDFRYLVCHSVINESMLDEIDNAVRRFHQEREIFKETEVRKHFSLPRQHSMIHYRSLIQMFGAPNGLCSSIMESKHIKAVKEPWRRSNRFKALGKMLVTNQRLDKLAAARLVFTQHNMLDGPLVPPRLIPVVDPGGGESDDEENGAIDGDSGATYDVQLARRHGTGP